MLSIDLDKDDELPPLTGVGRIAMNIFLPIYIAAQATIMICFVFGIKWPF